jgi:Fe(3+) dicitrate transport protein
VDSVIDGLVPFYIIMDVSVEYAFNKQWAVSGSINNPANKSYFTRRGSYPSPGIVPAAARRFY